jgi:hypothetical protein
MRDDLDGEWNHLAEVLSHPYEHASQECLHILAWTLGSEQSLDVWRVRRRGREEQAFFGAKALVENSLRDPGLLSDRPRRRRAPLLAKDLARDCEKILV